MGLGSFGGSSQMLFGGSGGQDLFQKITWFLVAIFMSGSLILTLMKSSSSRTLQYGYKPAAAQPMIPAHHTTPVADQAPVLPIEPVTTAPASN